MPGFFTNYEVVSRNIDKFKRLSELEELKKKITIPEKRDLKKLSKYFADYNLKSLPDVIILSDLCITRKYIIPEALKINIPIVGIADTNADISGIAAPIFANDDLNSSVEYIMLELIEVLKNE